MKVCIYRSFFHTPPKSNGQRCRRKRSYLERRPLQVYNWTYIYVYIYVCVCVCVFVGTYVRMHVYMHRSFDYDKYTPERTLRRRQTRKGGDASVRISSGDPRRYITGLQILALTLLHIHTLPGGPLPLLCSRAHAGVVRCPCPGSVPYGAAGWPAAGGMANGVVRLALAKSR